MRFLMLCEYRTQPKHIDWWKYDAHCVSTEFVAYRSTFPFQLAYTIKSRRNAYFDLLKAESDDVNGWYFLIVFEEDKKVAKISMEIFGNSIPEDMLVLKNQYMEWLEDPKTIKTEWVPGDFFEYVPDHLAQKKSNYRVLSASEVRDAKHKRKQEEERMHNAKRAKSQLPAWSDPVRNARSGTGVFRGMC